MATVTARVDSQESNASTALLRVIESSLRIQTPAHFIAWTEGPLQRLLPHELFICGVGQVGQHSIRIQKFLGKRFPLEYIKAIRQADGGIQSPVMARWCQERSPQLFEPAGNGSAADNRWLGLFHAFDLRNIAAHGMHDMNGNTASYFSFSRVPEPLSARHSHTLELLVPHMHVALMRALAQVAPVPTAEPLTQGTITPRESEVLRWLGQGKTNVEIAQILGSSENTVKNQVRAILIKFHVNNRTQAVSRALALGII